MSNEEKSEKKNNLCGLCLLVAFEVGEDDKFW